MLRNKHIFFLQEINDLKLSIFIMYDLEYFTDEEVKNEFRVVFFIQ